MSYAEYLALEERSPGKHEYLRGEVFAMSGGTPVHAALIAEMIGQLRAGLQPPCRVYSSDLKVRVEETDFSCFPDATVVCGKIVASPIDKNAVTNPRLVVEILSDSTEAHDRGAKAAHYRRIASLAEIVLVSSLEPLVEVHRRNERGLWELASEARAGTSFTLSSLGLTVDIDSLYGDLLSHQSS